jgi:sulfate/thiosulfate-binding protein
MIQVPCSASVSLRPCLPPVPATLALAVLLAVAGCGSKTSGEAGSSKAGNDLLLVSYAVTKSAYDRILPIFIADWKARTGQTLSIRTSYGGSASQTRAIIDGLEADVANLALGGDIDQLQKAGLIEAGWEKELPHMAVLTNSVVAVVTRPGNPKGIRAWKDLARQDVKVITANPKTSGGARWNFLALWGSVSQAGGTAEQAKTFVTSVYRNVDNLPRDAREASDAFLKRGQGDVLLNYENEAILARRKGELTSPYLVLDPNIRIEAPVAVVDRNVDRKGTRKAAEALAAYLQSEPAQTIFAEEGFRPVNPRVWSVVKGQFAPVNRLYSVEAFGGWPQVDRTFFARGRGLWDQLFRQSR